MDAPQQTSWHSSFIKILLKKLSISPSTRQSWIQILVTLLITLSIVGVIAWLENEYKEDNPQVVPPLNQTEIANQSETHKKNDGKCEYKFHISTIICLTSDLKLLNQLQNIAVLSAAILFFWDTFDRKKQLERQAWQLIDGAQGSETSGARKQAIEDLYKEGADITGLDADGADLRGINLSRANLERASFKNAILDEANFEGANLKGANFTGAKLRGTNFKKAKLLGADFTRADLTDCSDKKTDLRDADLGFATFNRAILGNAIFGVMDDEPCLGKKTNLNGAKLRDVNLTYVNLNQVCIEKAKLGGTTIENIEIIRTAKEYKKAYYSKNFYDAHKDEIEYVDNDYEEEPEFQQMTMKRIVEISQRLLNKESLSLQDEDSLSDFIELMKYLVIFFKETDNECFIDNRLSDKVLKVKKTVEESEKTRQHGLEIAKDNLSFIEKAKRELDELDKLKNEKDK